MKYPPWAIALMLIIGIPNLVGIGAAVIAVPEILIVVLGGAVFGALMTTKQIKTRWDKPGSRFNEHPPNEKARDDQDDPDLDGPD